jgi:tetratricopeptide (TPR) repeat protein
MKYANSFSEAVASYSKAIELSKDWLVEIATYVLKGRISEEDKALSAYKAKNVCGAAIHYENLASSGKLIGITDSVFYFYAGIFNEECGNFDKAVAHYTYCIELNFQTAECYSKLANTQVKAGKKEEAIKILGEARKKFPKNSSILRSEVNIYIDDKDYKKANDLLIALAEADPKNESVLYVLGVTYENAENFIEAERAYIKAIELNPAYFDAQYNLARLYYNRGVEKSNYCNNEIPLKETAKFEACKVEKRQMFATAAEHFRVCFDIDKEDPQLKKVLSECYRKSDQEAKISELN